MQPQLRLREPASGTKAHDTDWAPDLLIRAPSFVERQRWLTALHPLHHPASPSHQQAPDAPHAAQLQRPKPLRQAAPCAGLHACPPRQHCQRLGASARCQSQHAFPASTAPARLSGCPACLLKWQASGLLGIWLLQLLSVPACRSASGWPMLNLCRTLSRADPRGGSRMRPGSSSQASASIVIRSSVRHPVETNMMLLSL